MILHKVPNNPVELINAARTCLCRDPFIATNSVLSHALERRVVAPIYGLGPELRGNFQMLGRCLAVGADDVGPFGKIPAALVLPFAAEITADLRLLGYRETAGAFTGNVPRGDIKANAYGLCYGKTSAHFFEKFRRWVAVEENLNNAASSAPI
jgi:hypothetical protein